MSASLPLITVAAQPTYADDQSEPHHHKFVWAYDIVMVNESDDIVQLLNRFWRIIDMSGKVEEIHGTGVVGLQPLIKPGKTFKYTSFCQLAMPQGTMEGYYEMQDLNEKRFQVAIPKFVLSAPTEIILPYKSILH